MKIRRRDSSLDLLEWETQVTPEKEEPAVTRLDWGSSLGISAPDAIYVMECDIYGGKASVLGYRSKEP